MIGARPSDGSSSSTTSGRDISARDTASICCSPPDRLPARWLRRSCSTGIDLEPLGHVGVDLLVLADEGADTQVVLDGQLGERAASLRDVLAGRAGRCRPGPSRRAAGRAARRCPCVSIIPETARSVVVLPAPLAPRITTTSPSSTWKSSPCSTWIGPYPPRSALTSSSGVPRGVSDAVAAVASVTPVLRGRPRSPRGRSARSRGITFGDLAAEVEHDDVLRDAHHESHVVFDEQDREVVPVADVDDDLATARRPRCA